MKIPETSANIGAYYGNEENGQWQPNGVILDSGVGGGVVGSGDAGFVHHAPVYPMPRPHMPSPGACTIPPSHETLVVSTNGQTGYMHHSPTYPATHISPPGYMVAGAYYPAGYGPIPPPAAAAPPDDFSDYMWMENEEEFDKQIMQQLEEEALMEQCIEAMLEDERERERHRPVANGHTNYPTDVVDRTSNGSSVSLEEQVSKSTLNPLAAEFVPTFARPSPTPQTEQPTETPDTANVSEEKPTIVEVSATAEVQKPESPTEPEGVKEEIKEMETPEVSAADVQPIVKEEKRPETKRSKEPRAKEARAKSETKPAKSKTEPKPKSTPTKTKSEPKIPPKKKESPKQSKPEMKTEKSIEGADVVAPTTEVKAQPLALEEPLAATTAPAMKPINYAAAAKSTKPKKPGTPPSEKATQPKPAEKSVQAKPAEKTKAADKNAVQRKNSTK